MSEEYINSSERNHKMIDNTSNVYVPVRLQCGVTTNCRPQVLAHCPNVLQDLNEDLSGCLHVLPVSLHDLVKRTVIWINLSYAYGPIDSPNEVKYCTAHHAEAWLISQNDIPKKAKGIEIYDCFEYRKMRNYWNGCGLILHELCHLIHQLVLPDGLDNAMVKMVHKSALSGDKYKTVLRRDWAGRTCDTDMAYGIINEKEFFAEISVAYLCNGYQELDLVVTGPMSICSPPFIDQTMSSERSDISGAGCSWSSLLQILNRSSALTSHCNKFFPFTRGQLEHYDLDTFLIFQKLWFDISEWDDPDSEKSDSTSCSFLPLQVNKLLKSCDSFEIISTI